MREDGTCNLCCGRGVIHYTLHGPGICPVCSGDGRYRADCRTCGGGGYVVGLKPRLFGLLDPVKAAVTCPACAGSRHERPVASGA